MPFLPGVCVFPFVHAGLDYKASFYDFPKAADAIIKYYEDNPTMDGINHIPLSSGKSDETTGITTIDWPGRPGTAVPGVRYDRQQAQAARICRLGGTEKCPHPRVCCIACNATHPRPLSRVPCHARGLLAHQREQPT